MRRLAVLAMLLCQVAIAETWPADSLDWNTSPVDLSFLNAPEKPAGKRGFLRAQGAGLVFEDGTVARFWGTNLTAATLFETTPRNVRQQARRLSELGFNLVRIHHHDSAWVKPNIFGDESVPDTQTLDPAMLERLDWWIKCLKDEGIYVWLDLHVGRRFKPGDGIEGFDEIAGGEPGATPKGYSYVNAGMRDAMKRFNAAYVNHRNVHTGIPYKDEPAIMAMLLTNENDVTGHFGNALLPGKKVPQHIARYMAAAKAFATAHGLPRDKTWRSWEHGSSRLFLNDLERSFSVDLITHLRAQGVKVPIVTTSTWGGNPLSSLPALTAGDIIDVHSYGATGELHRNPLQAPNLLHWIAAAQVVDKPLSVTEWNVERFPVPDRHAIPLYLAASASRQGWDALMQYAYAQVPLNGPANPSNWHAFNDPALIATLPAAALLYRRGDVREAVSVYAFCPDADQLFGQPISPENAIALRIAAEKGKLVIALPPVKELSWLEKSTIPAGATPITDPNRTLADRGASEIVSDNGELRRNWDRGTFAIDTPRTQAAMGRVGGKDFHLADVRIAVTTANATVAVQSLNDKPISRSARILISTAAGSVPNPGREPPFISEPVKGYVSIAARAGLRLFASDGSTATREVPVRYANGRYRIDLGAGCESHFLVLRNR